MSYLFDTNAISETVRRQPNVDFKNWLIQLPRSEQFTSIVVAAELYAGAYGSQATDKWLKRLEHDILPRLTILDFDLGCANIYGKIRAYSSDTVSPLVTLTPRLPPPRCATT